MRPNSGRPRLSLSAFDGNQKRALSFCFVARLYRKTASRFFGRTLGDTCPQEIVDMDDADRHAVLHNEKRRDG